MKKTYDTGTATGIPASPVGLMTGATQPEEIDAGEYELSPEAQKEVDMAMANAMRIIHSKKMQAEIVENLSKVKPPQRAIAVEANRIFRMLELSANQRSKGLNEISMTYAAATIVDELIQIGEAAELFVLTDEEKQAAFQLALQMYFENGVRAGDIDPVELQRDVEPLMKEVDPKTYEKSQAVAAKAGLQGGAA